MMRFLLCFFLLFPLFVFGQTKLTGKVVAANEPNGMPGVSIAIKGTTLGTITDLEGKFSIDMENGQILIFSFVGYKQKEITFTGQANVVVTLEEDAAVL